MSVSPELRQNRERRISSLIHRSKSSCLRNPRRIAKLAHTRDRQEYTVVFRMDETRKSSPSGLFSLSKLIRAERSAVGFAAQYGQNGIMFHSEGRRQEHPSFRLSRPRDRGGLSDGGE